MGQYFTPCPLIEAHDRLRSPGADENACRLGLGGKDDLFLSAYNWLTQSGAKPNARQEVPGQPTFHGNEIVPGMRRMCLTNLFLHNMGEPSVERSDALIVKSKLKVHYVLANPPFGKKSSMTITNDDRDALTYER